MPIIKSAKKRVRRAATQRQLNLVTKRTLREAVKAFDAAVTAKDKKKVGDALNQLQGALDTAVKKNLMHVNKAARRKSQAAAAAKAVLGETKPVKAAPKAAAKPVAKKPAAKKTPVKKS